MRFVRDRHTRPSLLPAAACALVLSLFSITPLQAEEVAVPVGQQATGVEKPTMGMSMEMVETRFGEPGNRSDAVGNPPITRWDYAGFSVYFEYKTVIHAVAHKTPPAAQPAN
ncbi:hypothetical protein [Pseudomaricurvus sp. HS19]|uniref:hypothetical protein n=1 Tax=Pseudomaricurvus sp. HS19 TaxID=2692626 RepID=UPI00136A7207|nr:hypothetical protein [Pseudomaricurvus sp. HS19]MYM61860.1 hypothetical protein [Pseudomaricurvus sp. HS19]